jgi:hypothetical protein
MRQAADAQPDLRGLVFATTAETLIRACFPNIKPVDADWRRKVQALQRKIQEDGELDPTLRERAAGKLNALNELSNLEKIRQFLRWHVRDVEAQEEIFEQWKKLRNAAAHGAKTEQDFDQTERRIGVILDLCYAIVLTRIGFYGQWRISRQAHQKAWSIVPLSQSSSGALPLGATTVVSRFAWQPKKGGWARRVVVGQDPKAAILLVVQSKPQEGGAASFKINVAPKAVLPDGLARYQLAKSYTSWKDAAEVCDEIATRALVHLTVEHFS